MIVNNHLNNRWDSYKQMEAAISMEENFELRSNYFQTCLEDYTHFLGLTSCQVSLDYFIRKCWNIVPSYCIISIQKDDVIYSLLDRNDRNLCVHKVLNPLFLDKTNIIAAHVYDFWNHAESYIPAGMFYFRNVRYDIPEEIEKEMYTKCHQMKAVLITKTNQHLS